VFKLPELIAFVKDQERFHLERSKHFSDSKFRKNKHIETANRFSELADYLRDSSQNSSLIPEQMPLSLTQSDLVDLPDELIVELSISNADKVEFAILDILKDNNGILSLDQILVKYYKATGEILKRPTMTNRLYRMGQKGLVSSVPGRKGIYTTSQIADDSSAESPDKSDEMVAWYGGETEQNA